MSEFNESQKSSASEDPDISSIASEISTSASIPKSSFTFGYSLSGIMN
jgi:hypothetical protein